MIDRIDSVDSDWRNINGLNYLKKIIVAFKIRKISFPFVVILKKCLTLFWKNILLHEKSYAN
jgi:hypothetical protein